MAKVRVYELAKEIGVESKVVMAKLQELGEFVRSASSTVEAPVVRKLKDAFPAATGGSCSQSCRRCRVPVRRCGRGDGNPPDGARRPPPECARMGPRSRRSHGAGPDGAGTPVGLSPDARRTRAGTRSP